MSSLSFDILPKVKDQARELGMFGNIDLRLQHMVKHSAPFTHPDGNRRYEGYVMNIEDHTLVSIQHLEPCRNPTNGNRPTIKARSIDCSICGGTEMVEVYEENDQGDQQMSLRPCVRAQTNGDQTCDLI